jgi:SAM-dependent methyltransferase
MAVPIRGALDVVSFETTRTLVQGWVFSFDDGGVRSMDVFAGRERLPSSSVQLNQASPDIAAAYPDVSRSDRSRFTIESGAPPPGGGLCRVEVTFENGGRASLYGLPADLVPRPPDGAIHFIGGGFQQAFEFVEHFVARGGLKPDMDVLDVGCGVGRMAVPLAHLLEPSARYCGFDVARDCVEWATEAIGRRFPRFEFRHVDVQNGAYNPHGKLRSVDFPFPYANESFDFAFLTSVFTHLRAAEIRHYLAEIRRVLRPRGRCLFTCFSVDAEAVSLLESGRGTTRLVHEIDEGFTSDPEVPESAIGFPQRAFERWIEEARLRLAGRFEGAWCGRPKYTSYQDVFVVERLA